MSNGKLGAKFHGPCRFQCGQGFSIGDVGMQRRNRPLSILTRVIYRWCCDLEEILPIVYFRGLIQRGYGSSVASFFVSGLGSFCLGLLPRNAAVDGVVNPWHARFEF